VDQQLRDVPGDKGLPLLGHTLEIIKDIQAFFERKTKKHGEVFSTGFLGEEWIRLTGPEGCEFLLKDSGNHFSTKKGWETFVGELFPRGLMLKDGEEHLHHRRIMQSAFNKDAMVQYQALMNDVIPQFLNNSNMGENIEFSEYSREMLLEIASLVFIGESDTSKSSALQKAFRNTVEATMAIIRKPIPGTKYNRGLKGREFLEGYFLSKVPEKRNDTSGNLFSKLCQASDEEGNGYTDQNIADHMIFLMMAAQDTTSSSLTSLIYALTEYPEWQDKLREEFSQFESLSYEDLTSLELTSCTFKEALRMFTPGAVIPRRSKHEVNYKGFRIPANTVVSVSPIHNHFLPEFWTNPTKFDPYRFSVERAEHKQHPYLFVPFSGGVHKCIGLHFAEMEIKMILFYLLKNFRIKRDTSKPVAWIKAPVWQPKKGLNVTFEAL
jgi:cytochrome P450